MKRISTLAGLVLLGVSLAVLADGPDDQFLKVFNTIQQADALRDGGQERGALDRYRQAREGLKKIQAESPDWNKVVIDYRLKYVEERIKPLEVKFPGLPVVQPQPPTNAPPSKTEKPEEVTGLERQLHELNEELIRYRIDKTKLEAKLKEALSARPPDVDPTEHTKANETIKALQKELDVQKTSLDQALKQLADIYKEKTDLQKRITTDKSDLPALRKENDALRRQMSDLQKAAGAGPKVDDLTRQLAVAKAELKAEQNRSETLAKEKKQLESLGSVKAKADDLARQLAQAELKLKEEQTRSEKFAKENKKMEALLTDPSAALPGQAEKIKTLEKERDELKKKLDEALKKATDKKK